MGRPEPVGDPATAHRRRPTARLVGAPKALRHSEEVERGVLGIVFGNPFELKRVAPEIREDDFYLERHRLIWRACLAVQDRLSTGSRIAEPADYLVVEGQLQAWGVSEQAGGFTYLAGLDQSLPDFGRLDHYIQLLKDLAQHRRTELMLREILAEAQQGDTSGQALLGALATGTEEILRTGSLATAEVSIGDAVLDFEPPDERRGMAGIPTGIPDLDQVLDGLQPGRVVVIGGRPGSGKSALAGQIARHTALAGHATLVHSMEMRVEELTWRYVSAASGVPFAQIARGGLSDHDLATYQWGARRLHGHPLWMDCTGRQSIQHIEAAARRRAFTTGLRVLVVDYLQLMEVDGWRGTNNTHERLGLISRTLKQLALDLGITVLLLSQLRRPATLALELEPPLSELKASGDIEQDADQVVMVVQPARILGRDHEDFARWEGLARLLIPKNRSGVPDAAIELPWSGPTMVFGSGLPEPPQPRQMEVWA